MHSNVIYIKNVSWPHFSWPTLYVGRYFEVKWSILSLLYVCRLSRSEVKLLHIAGHDGMMASVKEHLLYMTYCHCVSKNRCTLL